MHKNLKFAALLGVALAGTSIIATGESPVPPPHPLAITAPPPGPFTFFVTSKGSDKGGDLGGLAGADARCQSLAAAVNAGHRTWHAYLSTQSAAGQPAVNARDRIGTGPWYNVKGDLIALNVADLHGDAVRDRNQINKTYALDENGKPIDGIGDALIHHNILTGSQYDGHAWPPGGYDTTCRNWTSSAPEGSAIVGHSDRTGLNTSWNQAHPTPGCDQKNMNGGYGGMLYCFAIN